MKKAIVSICCNTYNHEAYIRQTLQSFIDQQTDYVFEVLVYDDASTDNTQSIIKEFEDKYPETIKPIYQTTNQYSQRLRPSFQNRQRAKSKYVAICEGDDYWCDNKKLQKQIDYMEKNPRCTFCFTNGITLYGEEFGNSIIPWNKASVRKKNQADFNPGELEMIGYIPTASFIYRNGYFFPEMPEGAFMGDAYIKHIMTYYGYAHYIDEITVVYRRANALSATAGWENLERFTRQADAFIKLYEGLKELNQHKYDDVFNLRICEWKIEKYYRAQAFDELKKINESGEYKCIRRGNLYYRINMWMKCKHPKTFIKLRKILKGKMKSLNR